MTDIIGYIAGSVGCIFVLQTFLWWRSARKWKLEKQKAQLDWQRKAEEAERQRQMMAQWRRKAEEAQHQLQTLVQHPPTPADPHFARHLSDLCDRITGKILSLDDTRLRSVDPLQWVATEAEGARQLDRKKRLTDYFETLRRTNIEINLYMERLIECHTAAATLCDLMKTEQLNMPATDSLCATIDEIIQKLKGEESPDETWHRRIAERGKEFEPIYQARVRKSELESAERNSVRLAASLAFGQHQLPPMTPLAKFRSLTSHGQRDSLE
jgi:hypothetical protein